MQASYICAAKSLVTSCSRAWNAISTCRGLYGPDEKLGLVCLCCGSYCRASARHETCKKRRMTRHGNRHLNGLTTQAPTCLKHHGHSRLHYTWPLQAAYLSFRKSKTSLRMNPTLNHLYPGKCTAEACVRNCIRSCGSSICTFASRIWSCSGTVTSRIFLRWPQLATTTLVMVRTVAMLGGLPVMLLMQVMSPRCKQSTPSCFAGFTRQNPNHDRGDDEGDGHDSDGSIGPHIAGQCRLLCTRRS